MLSAAFSITPGIACPSCLGCRPRQIGRNQPQAVREEGGNPPLAFFTCHGDRVGFSEAFRTSGTAGNVPGFGQTVNWNRQSNRWALRDSRETGGVCCSGVSGVVCGRPRCCSRRTAWASTAPASKDELRAADGRCRVPLPREQGDTGPGAR